MLKMLIRLYVILLVTYSLASYLVPDLVLRLFYDRNYTYNLEQAQGTLRLIQHRFSQAPTQAWPGLQQELSADLSPLQLRVLPEDAPSLSDPERALLQQGRIAVRMGAYGELGTALAPLAPGAVLELLWPDPPVDINAMYWLMNILIGAALLACLLLWVRPHWRDLQRLQKTATRLGQGDFGVRTTISPRSNIGELAQVFDTMAQDIERLLAQQQELLNAVSHELRTPLSRLEFGLALISADPLEPATRQRLQQMVEHVRALDGLVNELLSYTGLQRPYQRAALQSVQLHALLDSVLGAFMDEDEHHGIAVALDLDHAPNAFTLDPKLTARALQNLVGNAVRYANHRVRIKVTGQGVGQLVIGVEDDGIGIPPQEWQRVFEPFYRMDRSRDRATGGFGLGLAISRRAIECQGGTLRLGASPLGGAAFEIVLGPPSSPA